MVCALSLSGCGAENRSALEELLGQSGGNAGLSLGSGLLPNTQEAANGLLPNVGVVAPNNPPSNSLLPEVITPVPSNNPLFSDTPVSTPVDPLFPSVPSTPSAPDIFGATPVVSPLPLLPDNTMGVVDPNQVNDGGAFDYPLLSGDSTGAPDPSAVNDGGAFDLLVSDDTANNTLSNGNPLAAQSQPLVGNLLPQTPAVQRQMFASMCVGCHGANGGGASFSSPIGPNVCTRVNCSDITALFNYVNTFMPRNNPSACTQECALAVAQLIQGGFVARDVNNILPGEDVGDIIRRVFERAESFRIYNHETGQSLEIITE